MAGFDFAVWFASLPILLAAAMVTWLISLPLRNVAIADTLWSLMLFMAGVVYALGSDPRAPRLSLVLWMLAAWALRLALHITWRTAGRGEPRRYREMRERHDPGFAAKSLYQIFLPRAGLAWVISLPLLGAFSSIQPLGWLDYLGLMLWGIGMFLASVADWQLNRFKRVPDRADKVLDRGLWRFTRHPNYLGEACVWWGFYALALSAGAWWSAVGPLLLTALLLRRGTAAKVGRDIPTTS